MDRNTAREILSVYRPNGADALDETLREALAFSEHDRETRDWLVEQNWFDENMATAVGSIPVPTEGRNQLLEKLVWENESSNRKRVVFHRFWAMGAGIAAILVTSLLIFSLPESKRSGPQEVGLQLETFSIPHLADRAMPLEFRADHYEVIESWLAAHQTEPPDSLPTGFETRNVLGCRRIPFEGNGSVTLLCFESGGAQIHLFVFDGDAHRLIEDLPDTWRRDNGWNVRRLPAIGPHSFAVATQADPQSLDASI